MKGPKPWEDLADVAVAEPELAPLVEAAEDLAEGARKIEGGGDEKGARRAYWSALKRVREIVSAAHMDDTRRGRLRQYCQDAHQALERMHVRTHLRSLKPPPGSQFGTLAYLFARGDESDVPLLQSLRLRTVAERKLAARAESAIRTRSVVARRDELLPQYHALLLRVQRGQGTEADEAELATMLNRLDEMDRALFPRSRRAQPDVGLRRLIRQVHRDIRGLLRELKSDGLKG